MIEKLKIIIAEVLELDDEARDQITESSKLREDLGFDSLQLAQLTVEIEDEFDVDVFEDGIVSTIKEILEKL
jgi:acyl carrier protein